MTFREKMMLKRANDKDFDLFVGTCITLVLFHLWKG
jgi:hypothetical protein